MSKSFDKFAADPKNYSSAEEATVPSTFVSDPNVFDFSLQQQHESWLDKIRVKSAFVAQENLLIHFLREQSDLLKLSQFRWKSWRQVQHSLLRILSDL